MASEKSSPTGSGIQSGIKLIIPDADRRHKLMSYKYHKIIMGLIIFIIYGIFNPAFVFSQSSQTWLDVFMLDQKIGYFHKTREQTYFQNEPVTKINSRMVSKFSRFGINIEVEQNILVYLGEDLRPRFSRYNESMSGSDKIISTWVRNEKMDIEIVVGEKTTWLTRDIEPNIQFNTSLMEVILAKGLIAGSKYDFTVFYPELGRSFELTVSIGSIQRIGLADNWYEVYPVKSDYPEMPQLSSVAYISRSGDIIKVDSGNMGIQMVKTTEDKAQEFNQMLEMSDLTRIKSNVNFRNPDMVTEVKLKLRAKEGNIAELIPIDDRQYWENILSPNEGILIIRSLPLSIEYKAELPLDLDKLGLAEFTTSSPYIESHDADIQNKAIAIAGTESNIWNISKKIAHWVYHAIDNKGFDSGFASAKNTLNNLKGDCTEHSFLFAALTRSLGIPTKIVVGLSAIDDGFYYHMWNMVYAGEWVDIDATLNQYLVDATHIKLGKTESIENETSDTALQLLRLLNKIEITVLEYTMDGKKYIVQPTMPK